MTADEKNNLTESAGVNILRSTFEGAMMKQLKLKFRRNTWGGKRKGAGRKNRTHTVNHMRRPTVDPKKPMNITMKLKAKMPNLRRQHLLRVFQKRIQRAARFGFRVIHYSLLENHLHMIVEVDTHTSRARGVQSLIGQFAKSIRKLAGGKGSVFNGRYHVRQISSPRQMRNTYEYVLQNLAKHMKVAEHLDFFSSAWLFDKWPQLLGRRRFCGIIRRDVEQYTMVENLERAVTIANNLEVFKPRTWLASIGWLRACDCATRLRAARY